jgi:hypothetical protein
MVCCSVAVGMGSMSWFIEMDDGDVVQWVSIRCFRAVVSRLGQLGDKPSSCLRIEVPF